MHPISYAQNGEDVVLQRALSDIENGFYIDIGAFDPVLDSVTKAFYDSGWSGINVEPVPEFHAKFIDARNRDTNLNIAVGKDPGLLKMSVFDGTGLSTFSDSYASRHEAAGFAKKEILISMVTGENIFENLGGRAVHFLKIDVEGSEADIIRSIDFRKHRPWIVLAEATEPCSELRSDAEWAPILNASGYEFVYFDGLNAFFLAEEHADRRAELAKPPNVFDSFITYSNHKQREALADSQRINSEYQAIIESKSKMIDRLQGELEVEISCRSKIEEKISTLESEVLSSKIHTENLEKNIKSQSSEIVNLKSFLDELYP